MGRCPFCRTELGEKNTLDLFGKTTKGDRHCPSCGFRVDRGKRGPARYLFELE
jgi:hypothetical protein